MISSNPTIRRPATRRAGFSLIEVVVAVSIVGTAVLGLFYAQHAFHQGNGEAARQTTALGLANELREMTLTLPLADPTQATGAFGPEAGESGPDDYDDVDDFDGADGGGSTFNPPIDATGLAIEPMQDWRQTIVVQSVDPANISGPAVADGSSDLIRMTVTVSRRNGADGWREITSLTWLRSP